MVTTRQLLASGASPDAAERRVRSGHWQRPARGVYARTSRPLTPGELGRVAAALAGQPVVVSGLVPLRLLGLRWLPACDGVLALVDPAVRTPSSGRVTLRRSRGLADLATWRHDEVAMAPVERAVVDAARGLTSLRDVRGLVLGAVADGWATPSDLRVALDGTQRNGSALARRSVVDAERGCASPPEAELVDALLGRGRPFLVNPELHLAGRLLGSPDVWLVDAGLAGEVESRERHGSEADTESTYDRHEGFAAAGVDVVHLSVRRIRRDPDEAARHLLARGAARRREPMTGLVVVPRGPLLR